MKKFKIKNINTPDYWNSHQTALDFGLRQQKYLELAVDGDSICEVGCGLSPFLAEAQKKYRFAIGLDFSKETVENANKLYPEVWYVQYDARDLDKLDKKYDIVVAGEIIEHLEEPDKFVNDLENMANKQVIISTPILEFEDPEHLWEFDEDYFKNKGYKTEIINSERFNGRKYIFAYKLL